MQKTYHGTLYCVKVYCTIIHVQWMQVHFYSCTCILFICFVSYFILLKVVIQFYLRTGSVTGFKYRLIPLDTKLYNVHIVFLYLEMFMFTFLQANQSRDSLAQALYCRTVAAVVKRVNNHKRPIANLTVSTDSSNESHHHGKVIQ